MFISIEIELFCVRLFCYLVILSPSSALELALYAGGMLTQDKQEAGPGPCQTFAGPLSTCPSLV